jgi:oligosaccharide reducing-end xylanase
MPKVPKVYEIAPWYDFKPAAITYSFDDGTFNQIQKGVPLLDKYYLKGSFNLITSWEHDWEAYRKAAENGHEISSHTVNHPNLKNVDLETQAFELKDSKKFIEKMIGQECITLVYPYCDAGDYDLAKKYFISARSCSGDLISPNPQDMFELSSIVIGNKTEYQTGKDLNKWAEKAYNENKWLIFLIHGIDGDGGYSPIESFELENHFRYVQSYEDRYWSATFKDVSKYILEANSLVIEDNENEEGNIIITVFCEYTSKITKLDFPITISRTIDSKSKKPKILNENNSKEIKKRIILDKIIFDVVPGEKYILNCE